jgi:hypothetical protein
MLEASFRGRVQALQTALGAFYALPGIRRQGRVLIGVEPSTGRKLTIGLFVTECDTTGLNGNGNHVGQEARLEDN